MTDTDQKPCAICGNTFIRGNLSRKQFAVRQTCSPACGTIKRKQSYTPARKVITENKDCIVCGKNFVRKRNIANNSWITQRFCAKECWYAYATGKSFALRNEKGKPNS